MSKSQELYAFWKYDLYPYILGGVVKELKEDGKVYIQAYQGVFKPIKLLPREAGEELHRRIKVLELARINALKQFDNEWEQKLNDVFKL